MSLCPSTVASSGNPQDFYFALQEAIPAPQVLSQAGNTISLSAGGGTVNVASATSVALSTQKLTAVTFDTGLLETNVDGVLNVGLGSAIGSTRVEGGNIVISRSDSAPRIELNENGSGNTSAIFQNGPNMFIDAPTSDITINAKGNKATVQLLDDSGDNGSINIAANNSTTGASSGLSLQPTDARITGSGLVQLQSLTGGFMSMDGSGIYTSAIAGNLTLEAINEPTSKAILRATAGVDVISSDGDITMEVGNAAGRINLTGGTALITNVPPIGITGNFLQLTINSVTYKIALVV